MKSSSTSPASSPGCPWRPRPAPGARHWRACSSASRTAASRRTYGRAARRIRRRAHSRCHGWRPSARPRPAARSKARCRSGNPSARRDRGHRPSPAAAPAPAAKAPSPPGRRHRDAPRANRCPRRNDRRRGCRSTATAIPACAAPSAGSRMVARGITRGWRSISLTLVRSLVTPAMEVNSPPAIVVGTLIWRTVGAFIGGETPPAARILSMPSTVVTSLARQSCTALAPSVIEPPPTVTMRSAPGGAGLIGGRYHGRARRMRRHRVEGADAARAQRAADVFDHVGLAVQRAADHQKGAVGAQPVHLLDDHLGCRPSENDFIHGAEYHAPSDARLSSPDILALLQPCKLW